MAQRITTTMRIILSIVTLAAIGLAAQAGQRWPGH
jgi:hypothetical protein